MYRARGVSEHTDTRSQTSAHATAAKTKSVFAPRHRRGNIHICCLPIRKQWLIRNQFYSSIVLLSISYIFFIAGIVLANLYATRMLVLTYAQAKVIDEGVNGLTRTQAGMIDTYYQLFLTTAEEANLFTNLIKAIMLDDPDRYWWNEFPYLTPTNANATLNFTKEYLANFLPKNSSVFSISTTKDGPEDFIGKKNVTWNLMQRMTLLNKFIGALNNTNTSAFRKRAFGFLFYEGKDDPAAMITYPAGYNISFPINAPPGNNYWYTNVTAKAENYGLFHITVRYHEDKQNSDFTRVVTLSKMVKKSDGSQLGIVFTELDMRDIQSFNDAIVNATDDTYKILFVQENQYVANYLPNDPVIGNNNETFFPISNDNISESLFTDQVFGQLMSRASSSVSEAGALFAAPNGYTDYGKDTYYNVIGSPNDTIFASKFYLTLRQNANKTHDTLQILDDQIQSGLVTTLYLAGGIQLAAFAISFIAAIMRAASFLKPLTILSEFAESIHSSKKGGKDNKQKNKQEDFSTASKKEIANIEDVIFLYYS